MECEQRLKQREIAETRRRLDRERYEFVAVYGKTTITGADFQEVGDQLAALGFLMASATTIALNTVRVPHPTRKPAAIQRVERERNGG
jgi:hypothetical protein